MAKDNNLYFGANRYLIKWDNTNDKIEIVHTFDDNVSFLGTSDNLNYIIISEKNKIWSYDLDSKSITYRLGAPASIMSLCVTDKYLFIDDNSGAWSTFRLITLNDFFIKDSIDWRDPSRTIVYSKNQNCFYMFRDGTSPNDIQCQVIDTTNDKLLNYYDSIYHGDYSLGHPIKIFPDETKLVVGSGNIFSTDKNITYSAKLSYGYSDLVFIKDKIYIINNNNSICSLIILSQTYPYQLIKFSKQFSNQTGRNLFYDGTNLIMVKENNKDVNIIKYDIDNL